MNDAVPREGLSQDQIEVHWQHPRHELEKPVLLVWPNPLRENWAVEVLDDNRAKVVVREVMIEVETADGGSEIEKHTEQVDLCYDTIPQYVEDALLTYDGQYGPVEQVINEVDSEETEIPDDPTITFDAYFTQAEIMRDAKSSE